MIKRELPTARLRLAGRDTDGLLKPAGPDIDVLGWVADSAAEIGTWSAAGPGCKNLLHRGFFLLTKSVC